MAIPNTLLPLQGSSYQKGYSLDRDAQLRTLLEAAFEALVGSGIAAGGAVTPTAGFSAEVETGTTFFSKGVGYTLSAPLALTAPEASATNYAWWKLSRVAADQAAVTNLDTWSLSVVYTTVNVPPAGYYPLTQLVCDGAGITSVVDPAGKYVGVLRVDESLLRDGTRDFTGDQSMAGFRLTNLPTPEAGADATPRDWVLDAISDALAELDVPDLAGVILASGGVAFAADQSMGDHKLTNVADPVADQDVANKRWVVATFGGGTPLSFLKLDGSNVMGANLDAGGHQVVNAADPTTDGALVPLRYLNSRLTSLVITGFLPLSGGTLSGALDMGNHQITNLTDPSADQHAATQGWTNVRIGTRLPLSGGTMTGPINMDGKAITALPDPVNPQDPATMAWAEALVGSGVGQPIFFGVDARGLMDPTELLGRLACPQDVIWGGALTAAKSSAKAVVPATGTAVLKLYSNILGTGRTEIGTITFAAGSTDGVVAFPDPVTLSQGQLIETEAPAVADATLQDLAITLAGELA